MGGDPECFTAWIPLHDCPINVGPLRVLEGSHRFGFQHHDRENLHAQKFRRVRKSETNGSVVRSMQAMYSFFIV